MVHTPSPEQNEDCIALCHLIVLVPTEMGFVMGPSHG